MKKFDFRGPWTTRSGRAVLVAQSRSPVAPYTAIDPKGEGHYITAEGLGYDKAEDWDLIETPRTSNVAEFMLQFQKPRKA